MPNAEPMVVGVHGTLELRPEIRRAWESGELDEDLYSLTVQRAEAYGLTSTVLGAARPRGARWAHNEAGGDWTQDGTVREIGYLQVDVADAAPDRPLPTRPAFTVLTDALRHVGTFAVAGVHVLAPPRPGAAGSEDLTWPTDEPGGTTTETGAEVTVTLAARNGSLADRAQPIRQAVTELSSGRLDLTPAPPESPAHAFAHPPTGTIHLPEATTGPGFRCRTPTWSLDAAVHIAELLLTALGPYGTGPALVSVAGPTVARARGPIAGNG
ncbi:hypothetical protein OYE22_11285 [Streptomyces sp. 71268]|uniref:hypothetical protein n=1 Tax=Streptomyces sp. 71268 TaxID=3002640 RepID=UPI0023F868C7|nr:hypothetical protein [Streptomyces sp. 71268]WEV25719.1 hypothetical protein OYE22_11285 [Streptomyces sp. 71268]